MSEGTKGVVLVMYEDGTEKLLPKVSYLQMKKAGRARVRFCFSSHIVFSRSLISPFKRSFLLLFCTFY